MPDKRTLSVGTKFIPGKPTLIARYDDDNERPPYVARNWWIKFLDRWGL
jgi:hypothetical protein